MKILRIVTENDLIRFDTDTDGAVEVLSYRSTFCTDQPVARASAVAENGTDIGGSKDFCQIVRLHLLNAGIRRTDNSTAADHIPQGNAVTEKHGAFFLHGNGQRFIQNGTQNPPEAILRVSIKERRLPRFDGWKRAENKNF